MCLSWYLVSIISTDGYCHRDIKSRISSASRAMGALRQQVFADSNLSLPVKSIVFEACVVALLLYGSACWVPLRRDVVVLSVFYNTNIRTIMGISQRDVWEQRFGMSTIFQAWNSPNTRDIGTRLEQRRLEWLGHVCRIPEHGFPRISLFGCLLSRRPACGPRLCWRDLARRDLGRHNVRGNSWYLMTQVRPEWRQFYTAQCDDEKPPKDIDCEVCGHSFRRQAECSAERALPVRLQVGS